MTLARIRQTCLLGHLLTMVLLASDDITGEERGEVAGGDGKVTAHLPWTRQHLDTETGKEAGKSEDSWSSKSFQEFSDQ